MSPKVRRALFEVLRRHRPSPRSELEYQTPYQLLVSVMLSAQATDISVNKATGPLFEVADTPQAMLDLGLRKLRGYIRSIGLYNTKARNIIEATRLLVRKHGGQVPRDRESLESLPGVGRKTANVVLNTAFGEPVIAVDTHIFRVANRTGIAPGRNVREVEDGLMKYVPREFRRDAHHWLILHGRYTCTARAPRCDICVIRPFCEWEHKDAVVEARAGSGGKGKGKRTQLGGRE